MLNKEGAPMPENKPQFLSALENEIAGLKDREELHYQTAREVDRVLVITGCDDSRQGIPQGVQEINWNGQKERVLFEYIPGIGGGFASDTLLDVVDHLIYHKVDPQKITVLTTQHGNTAEVSEALKGVASEAPTCGLRGVLKKVENGEHVHVFDKLLEHASKINLSSSIIKNGDFIYERTKDLLREFSVEVLSGYYDHQGTDHDGKMVAVTGGVDNPFSFTIPDQSAWHDKHQDPPALVVSFGKRAASLPDGVVLPSTVGDGANNDFNSSATEASSFKSAMYEQWYALSHVGGHEGDSNFENTQLMVILCDGGKEVLQSKKYLHSEEFKENFAPFVRKLVDSGVYLVNINLEKAEFIRV